MSTEWSFKTVLPWLTWAGVAIACAVGYVIFLLDILGRSGAWVVGPTFIVTLVLVMGFAIFVWLPASWAMTRWYHRPNWIEALVVSGALGSVVTTIFGIGLLNNSNDSPLYGWFLLVAFMTGAASHAHTAASDQPPA